ncbi:N-acetylmuramoyl-L-alanine amidase [Rufibacter roseus]|uniref:N-acetylmuramoyl-L-alanine amidase n=1 Tax=Rufibacter roseus TaxID=1567108 RepID=A0ABW2DI03_9BACT|nr:N-acetylmuramoyl-L-alanine amidase [Rufibacter roseus]
MTKHIQNICFKAALAVCLVFLTLTVQGQVIVIDPGHGYKADGSNPDGRTDTEIATALSVGLKLRDQLNSQCSNYKVHMTRTTRNGWISISQRRDMSNSWGANRFISIHCNAGGGTGTETFWCNRSTSGTTANSNFSQEVQNRMAAGGSWTNRRSVEDATYIYHLGVLNSNNAVGVLNEIGFVDSNDKTKLLDDSWRNKFAAAYVTALKNSLGTSTCSPSTTSILIQGESYSSAPYVQTEACSDTGGGLNVSHIDTGDQISYSNVTFPSSGSYKIEYRVASLPGGGTIEAILTGVVILGRVNVPATGGWQTGWTTISHTVNINQAGTYTLRLSAISGGWNLNWLRISKVSTARMATANMEVAEVAEAPVPYPNPADNELSVRFAGTAASGKVLNSVGQTVLTLPTLASDTPIDISSLKSGVYILDMVIDGKKVTKRFIKR